jgi:hypothetical protein
LNLFSRPAGALKSIVHLSVGRKDAESQQLAIFGIKIRFNVEIIGAVAVGIKKPAIMKAPEGWGIL